MKKKIKHLGSFFALFLFPAIALAQTAQMPDCGLLGLSCQPISAIIANLAKWLLGIFGFIAVISFVIAGIQYLISAGDENIQQRAKRNVVYSIIGVIVGLGGLVIINAVQNMLGANSNF
jgi:hypothetical protein